MLERINHLSYGDSICHGDPNPGNIINQNGRPIFIDWMNCVKGHPYYDIAQYILMVKYPVINKDMPNDLVKMIVESREQVEERVIP